MSTLNISNVRDTADEATNQLLTKYTCPRIREPGPHNIGEGVVNSVESDEGKLTLVNFISAMSSPVA